MTQLPAQSATPATSSPFEHEPDGSGTYWSNHPLNTLPPPDTMGAYMRNRPLPPEGIAQRHAYIIGTGIAGLAAAFYLIRDGGMPAANITLIDSLDIEGGSLDGAGNPEQGYLVRGGREMNWNYDNFWDLFQDVPALELPEGFSVLDEYRAVNDHDPNWSKARLLHQQGRVKDFSTFGLSRGQQWELVKLLLKRKEELDDVTIEDYFSEGFLQSNFWFFWRSMFAFENWQSLLEMKLYMHRFLDAIDGLNDCPRWCFPSTTSTRVSWCRWRACCARRACRSSSIRVFMTWKWPSPATRAPSPRSAARWAGARTASRWARATWCSR